MTKNARRLVTLVAAMVMVFAMSITAFAAAPGTYATKLYGPTGTVMTHGNPITGADVVYDQETDQTTITIYTIPMTVGSVSGSISSMTLVDIYNTATDEVAGTDISGDAGDPVTIDDVTYTPITFTLEEDFAAVGHTFNISYSISMSSGIHRTSTGSLEIVAP